MTYTTKKILANFLDNEDGLLSKKFIDTATLLFGQSLAKRAFVEALRCNDQTSEYFTTDPIIVFPYNPSTADQIYNTVYDTVSAWYPGTVARIQSGNQANKLFTIYRVTPYTYKTRTDLNLDHLLTRHMMSSQEALGGPTVPLQGHLLHSEADTTSDRKIYAQGLTKELLYESLYDSVTAQGYNRPADSNTLREYIMSLMEQNPLFEWPRWAGEGGIVIKPGFDDLVQASS